jgi:hypothetical protein
MATLSIGKADFTIGAHSNQEKSGFATNFYRFVSSAQAAADKYADCKYNQTDWRAFRP